MKKLNLTTKLNIEIICIASLLLLFVIGHSQWIALEEKKNGYVDQLRVITEYLVRKMPPGSFAAIAERQGGAGKSVEEQVLAVNQEIQPILANILTTGNSVKFGIYSRQHGRIVAIGPNLDRSLLVALNPNIFIDMYKTNQAQLGENKNSITWYGAPILYYRVPISYNGTVIGHAFANVNMNKVYAEAWKRTINSFTGGLIALLIIVILFQDVFIRLKKDLKLFAEQILEGRAKHFESELPELTPILQYISEQTEKMAKLDRLNIIGEMAASIGHEVRNPMTTVRGFLQFMINKAEFQGYKEYLQLMIDELDRANSIITEFLSLAKNHAMDFKKTDLNKLIVDIAPLLQADAIRNNCRIEFSLRDVPDVLLDERGIRQLVLNMVRNAIEAMPQGGTITIGTVHCGPRVMLSIKDQGVGIPPEILGMLGTPFVTTKETGTGLGLPVCYRIVQRHEAAISVASEPGQGTVFTVEFNRA